MTLPLIRMVCSGETVFDLDLGGHVARMERQGRFQSRVADVNLSLDGLPMTTTPDEAAYQVQLLYRLLGLDLDFSAAIDPKRRQAIEEATRAHLKARGLLG